MNITAPSPTLRTSPPSIRAIGWSKARNVLSPLALLVLWQLGSASGVIPASKLAAPSAIVHAFWTLAVSNALWNDLVVSLGRVALGATIGVLLGIGLALAVGLWPNTARSPIIHNAGACVARRFWATGRCRFESS